MIIKNKIINIVSKNAPKLPVESYPNIEGLFMKLSIIIPALNEESLIGKCLNSVIASAKAANNNVEIIVVDNGSVDRTSQIALSYPGVIVYEELQRGTNYARQCGYLKATGELIANVDADSILPVNWINYAILSFNNDKNMMAMSGPYVFYDFSNYWQILSKIFFYLAYPIYVISNKYFNSGAVMGGNLVVRKSVLDKIGGYNTDMVFYGDDTDTAQRLSKIGRVNFDYNFKIYSSSRRFKNNGVMRTIYHYVINYVWVTLFNKSFSSSK